MAKEENEESSFEEEKSSENEESKSNEGSQQESSGSIEPERCMSPLEPEFMED